MSISKLFNILVLCLAVSSSAVADEASSTKSPIATSIKGSLDMPFMTMGGRLGLETPGGILQAGAEAGIGADGATDVAAVMVGGYVQVAPIVGEIGRRFYLIGRINETFSAGRKYRDFNNPLQGYKVTQTQVAVGYRMPTQVVDGHAQKELYFEAGVNKPVSEYCSFGNDDCRKPAILPSLTFGVAFR